MSSRRGPLVPLFALALCAALVWLYFTPYLALRRMQDAAERGDTATLSAMVDFPALRASLKDGVRDETARRIGLDRGGRPTRLGGVLAGTVAGAITDPIVNTMVTPAGVSLLLQGRTPGDGARPEGSWREGVRIDRGYEGINRFVVRYEDRETGASRAALVLRREGLGWRLVGARLGDRS
jgi:hypothetical protein